MQEKSGVRIIQLVIEDDERMKKSETNNKKMYHKTRVKKRKRTKFMQDNRQQIKKINGDKWIRNKLQIKR